MTCPIDENGIRLDHVPAVQARVAQNSNRIVVGASVRLWSVEAVCEDLTVLPDAARTLLAALGCPLLNLPGTTKQYVNLYGLESALFALSLPTTMKQTPDGTNDPELLRLHQELAGCMYLAATKEAVRERVKKLARQLGRGLTSSKKRPIIKK